MARLVVWILSKIKVHEDKEIWELVVNVVYMVKRLRASHLQLIKAQGMRSTSE